MPIAGVGSYQRASLKTRYEVNDHLGNTRVSFTTDGNGVVLVIEAHDYYPHGGLLPGRQLSGTGGSPLAYQGQEYDPEVGLTAFNLRQYDGRIGRWLTTDPYGQHHSPYLAMSNNPVSFIDPDGGFDYDGWSAADIAADEAWRQQLIEQRLEKFYEDALKRSGQSEYSGARSGQLMDLEGAAMTFYRSDAGFSASKIGAVDMFLKKHFGPGEFIGFSNSEGGPIVRGSDGHKIRAWRGKNGVSITWSGTLLTGTTSYVSDYNLEDLFGREQNGAMDMLRNAPEQEFSGIAGYLNYHLNAGTFDGYIYNIEGQPVGVDNTVRGVVPEFGPGRGIKALKGGYTVYRSVQNGIPNYFGITNNLIRRSAEHLRSARGIISMEMKGLTNLTKRQARAVEQVLIERFGLNNLMNEINSVAKRNPSYTKMIEEGKEILNRFGH